MQARIQHGDQRNRPAKRGLIIALLDVVLLIVALNIYALFHHVLPRKMDPAGSKSIGAIAAGSGAPMRRSNPIAAGNFVITPTEVLTA